MNSLCSSFLSGLTAEFLDRSHEVVGQGAGDALCLADQPDGLFRTLARE